jgi:hypothetical protein
MDRSKFFLRSRGMLGGIVTVTLGVLGVLGYQIAPEVEREVVTLGNTAIDIIAESVDGLVLVAAGGASIWSRLRKERRPLTAMPTVPPSA